MVLSVPFTAKYISYHTLNILIEPHYNSSMYQNIILYATNTYSFYEFKKMSIEHAIVLAVHTTLDGLHPTLEQDLVPSFLLMLTLRPSTNGLSACVLSCIQEICILVPAFTFQLSRVCSFQAFEQ